MFRKDIDLETLNSINKGTLMEQLGIEYIEVGEDYIKARMPVNERTFTPVKILHGGASVALAETLGSLAAYCCIDQSTHGVVGLEINANHIKSVKEGFVYGTTRPLHMGKRTHVWEIKIENEGES